MFLSMILVLTRSKREGRGRMLILMLKLLEIVNIVIIVIIIKIVKIVKINTESLISSSKC